MAKKIKLKRDYHPDTYRIKCDDCEKLFEATNDDFRYVGGNTLSCSCPWCESNVWRTIRELQRVKIHYGESVVYCDD